jgi:hypothetical protein
MRAVTEMFKNHVVPLCWEEKGGGPGNLPIRLASAFVPEKQSNNWLDAASLVQAYDDEHELWEQDLREVQFSTNDLIRGERNNDAFKERMSAWKRELNDWTMQVYPFLYSSLLRDWEARVSTQVLSDGRLYCDVVRDALARCKGRTLYRFLLDFFGSLPQALGVLSDAIAKAEDAGNFNQPESEELKEVCRVNFKIRFNDERNGGFGGVERARSQSSLTSLCQTG